MNIQPILIDESDSDFYPIDGPDTGLPDLTIAMLRICQIKLAEEFEIREITEEKISRWMKKYRNRIPRVYRPGEIRSQIPSNGEMRGGGVQIEWIDLYGNYSGFRQRHHFTFRRIIKLPPEVAGAEVKIEA